LIIMPAWNEAANVGKTLAEIRASGVNHDLVVVNDGSLDRTSEIAREAGEVVLDLPFNMGVGGAMRTGFTYAARHGYDRAIQVDADGQHDPRDIDRVLAGLERANISIGVRFGHGEESYAVRGPRRWAMRFLASVLSRVAKTTLTDVTSGFRAVDRQGIEQYVRYYPSEYLGDTIDSLVAAVHAGLTVTQVPVEMRPRRHGAPSKGPISSSIYLVRSCFALMLALMRRGRLKPMEEVP
jgi:glycosyltransferase involved in cell wall biosynthesis